MNDCLNIAAICPSTQTLGPGKRYVAWVQGCCFSCDNCGSSEWREMRQADLVRPEDLAAAILRVPDLEGITISGGEPMLQAANLIKLMGLVHAHRPLSVICYTGFTLEALKERNDQATDDLLAALDVLIDGPYMDQLNDNLGWRGSSNQRVHFLSGRYRELEAKFHSRRRDIEIHLRGGHYLVVGVHPKNFKRELVI